MNVLTWLEQVKKLDELIAAKIAERDRIMATATDISPKPISAVPFSHTGLVSRKVEDAVVEAVTLDAEINKLTDYYIDHKRKVIDALSKLPANEQGVLRRRYLYYMKWDDIAEDMDYSVQHVWRLKKKGLKSLEQVILCY